LKKNFRSESEKISKMKKRRPPTSALNTAAEMKTGRKDEKREKKESPKIVKMTNMR
jgi:hypothetical protein